MGLLRTKKVYIQGRLFLRVLILVGVTLRFATGITTIHYNKPQDSKLKTEHKTDIGIRSFPNISLAERQKRLLPYVNHYISQNLNHQPSQNANQFSNPQQYYLNHYRNNHQSSKYNNPINYALQTEPYGYQAIPQDPSKFTPFLPSNAIPGGFIPMTRVSESPPQIQTQPIELNYVPFSEIKKMPNFSDIYDKLSQLKFRQNSISITNVELQNNKNTIPHILKKPQIKYVQQTYNPQEQQQYVQVPLAAQPYIEETNKPIKYIHISSTEKPYNRYNNFNSLKLSTTPKPLKIELALTPQPAYENPETHIYQSKNYPIEYVVANKEYQYHTQNHNQFLQEITPITTTQPPITASSEKLLPLRYQYTNTPSPILNFPKRPTVILQPTSTETITPYSLEPIITHNGQPYETVKSVSPITPTSIIPLAVASSPSTVTESNSNSLASILYKLQESNTLPQTLTLDNIDNSIRTLVNILNSLKQKRPIEPIVVLDEENSSEKNIPTLEYENSQTSKPQKLVQNFPETEAFEGGTPGKPGVDYPALSAIPTTSFNCTTQRYKGFFADPETHCQVWHYCDLNGGQASFLCPNGTIFSQVALTCDWWFNVKCSTTTQLYVLNERLYKYIIPLTPKFPEDYTGPLVDKYLALKFKEMEDKLKDMKEKEKSTEKSEEIDELQLLEDKNNESSTASTDIVK